MTGHDDNCQAVGAGNECLVTWRSPGRPGAGFWHRGPLPGGCRQAAARPVLAGMALAIVVSVVGVSAIGRVGTRAVARSASAAAAAGLAQPIDGQLAGLSCSSEHACMAVGVQESSAQAGVPVAERWNGTRWVIEPAPNPAWAKNSDLAAVSCPTARACIAVGSATVRGGVGCTGGYCKFVPMAEGWNGSRWTILPTPSPSGTYNGGLGSVSCSSPQACIAVGSFAVPGGTEALAERWNGTRWAIEPTPHPAASTELGAVSCTSATTCIAAGSSGPAAGISVPLAARWKGGRWQVQTTPSPRGYIYIPLTGVSCTSQAACTAVGVSGPFGEPKPLRPFAEHWNGKEWTLERTPAPARAATTTLGGISCTSNGCTAVGSYAGGPLPAVRFRMLAERWNGRHWAIQSTPSPDSSTVTTLSQVSCTSKQTCIAVGYYTTSTGFTHPLAERWNGRRWTIQPSASNPVR